MAGRECAGCGANNPPASRAGAGSPVLLALYPGIRQTGWAALACGKRPSAGPEVAGSGTVALKVWSRVEPAERIAHLLEALSDIAARWRADCVVRSCPGGLASRAPGRGELDEALRGWADGLGLPLTGYAAPEVRAALAVRPNASKDALGHAVMLRLGLIGQSRAAAEWEAIAVGCHHLEISWKSRRKRGRGPAPPVDTYSEMLLG